jgi:alkylhydroperoxidase/carboxymuconolactone decarboxylase family protein YurZ
MLVPIARNGERGMTTSSEEVAAVRQRLAEFRERRGYVLPHQGVMAAALPWLLDGYGVMYRALTLEAHHLSALEREFVWLALLASAGEHVGTHHVDLFYRCGGTETQADAAFRVAAFGAGVSVYELLDRHWQGHFPGLVAARAYLDSQRELVAGHAGVTASMMHLAMIATQTGRRSAWGIAADLVAAYRNDVAENKIAEAMSLAMWPCGVNCFVEAAEIWLTLIRDKRVTPSPSFAAWADTPGQGAMPLAPRSSANPQRNA